MHKRHRGSLLKGFFATCLCLSLPLSGLAQTRTITTRNNDPVSGGQTTQTIQKVITQSTTSLQDGDKAFNEGDYEQARRAYDRAVDVILEAGIDVRTDSSLNKHYEFLLEHVFQRQLAAAKTYPQSLPVRVAANADTAPAVQVQPVQYVVSQQARQQQQPRGFGQQSFEPSPLDELAQLKLTEEETKDATVADVQSAVDAVRPDFDFKPNALVQSYINYYLGRGRATMESGLRRSGRFTQMAQKIFKEEGVPQDLVWLGQVESAWSPIARSWAAAVGLWQFIPGTGARYGLKQDYWIDERSSFERATRASARYLKWLSDRYAGNWELAMAAYNSGEGRIDSAIARSGYADFWEIYSRGLIPLETRNYVPNILATIIIAKNPERYGFNVKPEPPLTFDLVKTNHMVDLHLIADATDTSFDYLQALNPELKRGMTPPDIEHYVRVPVGKSKPLQVALNAIPADKRASWRLQTAQSDDTFETIARRTGVSESLLSAVNGGSLRPGQKVIIPSSTALRNVASVTPKSTTVETRNSAKIVSYKVRSGDNLGDVAARYGISVRDIATLNRIGTSTKLRAGQVLKVPVRQGR